MSYVDHNLPIKCVTVANSQAFSQEHRYTTWLNMHKHKCTLTQTYMNVQIYIISFQGVHQWHKHTREILTQMAKETIKQKASYIAVTKTEMKSEWMRKWSNFQIPLGKINVNVK